MKLLVSLALTLYALSLGCRSNDKPTGNANQAPTAAQKTEAPPPTPALPIKEALSAAATSEACKSGGPVCEALGQWDQGKVAPLPAGSAFLTGITLDAGREGGAVPALAILTLPATGRLDPMGITRVHPNNPTEIDALAKIVERVTASLAAKEALPALSDTIERYLTGLAKKKTATSERTETGYAWKDGDALVELRWLEDRGQWVAIASMPGGVQRVALFGLTARAPAQTPPTAP